TGRQPPSTVWEWRPVLQYLVKRLVHLIPTLLIVSFVVFALVRMITGDPVLAIVGPDATPEHIERMRVALGLDKPMLSQYMEYLTKLLAGDLGESLRSRQPVWHEIIERFPATLLLSGAGMGLS